MSTLETYGGYVHLLENSPTKNTDRPTEAINTILTEYQGNSN